MNDLLDRIYHDNHFINCIEDILLNSTVNKMKDYKQHYDISCFDHCLIASYYCYHICKKLNLDYISCARAAMVHDLFLYDWHNPHHAYKGKHPFIHPQIAYANASQIMNLNNKEADIILKHMWPVTFLKLPKYKESLVLTLVDKYCATFEFFTSLNSNILKKKAWRYAYIFLCLLLFSNK